MNLVVVIGLLLAPAAYGGSVPEQNRLRADELAPVAYPFRPARVPLAPGEQLEYEARWLGFPSGRLVLECRQSEEAHGRTVYNVRAGITFNSLMSPLYKVSNEVWAYLDAEEGYSLHFRLNKNEGRVRYSEDVHFDYAEMLAQYTREEGLYGRYRSRLSVQLPDKVSDPLSFLYYLRGVHLEPGIDVHLTVHTTQRNWNLTARVLKRMTLEVPRGEFRVLKVEPVACYPDIIERRGRMYLYLEEKTHVPVLMSTDIPIGSISFRLVASRNSPLDGEPASEAAEKPAEAGAAAPQYGSDTNSRAGAIDKR